MKPSPKSVLVVASQSATAGATVTGSVDTQGFDWLTLDMVQHTVAAATNKLTVCKISESDTTDATNYSDVTALVGGGAGGFAIPNIDTQNPSMFKFNLDLKKRKRYLKLSLSPATTQTVYAVANLHIAEQEPTQAADAGVAVLVNN